MGFIESRGQAGTGHASVPGSESDRAPDHYRAVVREVARQPRLASHVIAFANEKGGVGKSTLAFHTIMALSHQNYRVLAIDLDVRQQTLEHAFQMRDATARQLKIDLPSPQHLFVDRHSLPVLMQEIARMGRSFDVIAIDLPGFDTPLARRVIALADTLISPVNNSFADLDTLGRLHPVTMDIKHPGGFASMAMGMREARREAGRKPFDWVVVKNRLRGCEHRLRDQVNDALERLSSEIGFRIAPSVRERLAYRELLPFGLTHRDLKLIPEVARLRPRKDDEIAALLEALALPERRPPVAARPARETAALRPRNTGTYRKQLRRQLGTRREIA